MQPHLIDRDADVILNVAAAVSKARQWNKAGVEFARAKLELPAEQLNPPPLLTGDDLREAGIPTGPAYREILQTVRDKQLDGEIATPAEAILLARGAL